MGEENGDFPYALGDVMGRGSPWEGGGTEGRTQPLSLGRCSERRGWGPSNCSASFFWKDDVSSRRLLTKAEMSSWAMGWECLEQEEA